MKQEKLNEFIHGVLVCSTQMAYVEEAYGTMTLLENASGVFRYLNAGAQTVTLYCELEMLKKYIAFQKVRYGDRFNVHFHNDGSYDSVYIKRLAVLDSFDSILGPLMEQSTDPVEFTLEFNVQGVKPKMEVILQGSGERKFLGQELG